MAAAGTVHIELAGGWIIHNLEEFGDLSVAGITLVLDRDVYVAHALRFDKAFFLRRIVGQINNRVNAQRFEAGEIFFAWSRPAIKAVVHLTKVANLDV